MGYEYMANKPSVKLDFDMERLADNLEVVESVRCMECGRIHERSENIYDGLRKYMYRELTVY